jgi:hypothetical protein
MTTMPTARLPITSRAAGAHVRAGVFAGVGSVLGFTGHRIAGDAPVPWQWLPVLICAQYAVVLCLCFARGRWGLPAVAAATLGAQGAIHELLSAIGGTHMATGASAGAGHAHMPADAQMAAVTATHGWHHSTAMTAAHLVAALVVAWLMHRADAAMGVVVRLARDVKRTIRRVTVVAVPLPQRPKPPGAAPALRASRRIRILASAVVRRGPPVERGCLRSPSPVRSYAPGVLPCPFPFPFPFAPGASPWSAPPQSP